MRYEEQREALEYAIIQAHREHDAKSNRLTAKLLSRTYAALDYFKAFHSATSDIQYIADHIGELEEADFVSPFDYSNDVDSTIVELCAEFGV